jgi:hypothetical protein
LGPAPARRKKVTGSGRAVPFDRQREDQVMARTAIRNGGASRQTGQRLALTPPPSAPHRGGVDPPGTPITDPAPSPGLLLWAGLPNLHWVSFHGCVLHLPLSRLGYAETLVALTGTGSNRCIECVLRSNVEFPDVRANQGQHTDGYRR